jgi:uncharacterized protein (DUF2267 family)
VHDERAFNAAVIGPHAVFEMARRGISENQIRQVLAMPGRIEAGRAGRLILASLLYDERRHRDYVLRVVLEVGHNPPVVVTAYRSSKLRKYWSNP